MAKSVDIECGIAGNRRTSVGAARRPCARLVVLSLGVLLAGCGSEFPVAPAPVATSAVALSGTRYQGTLTLGNGTTTSLNMTLIARGLAARALNRRSRAATGISVSGNFSTGNGLTGTIQGSLTGSLENGVFDGSLTTSAGQVQERNYSGPVTSTSAAWAPGSCVRNCTPDGLSGAVQTVLTGTDTPPPPCTYAPGAGDRTFEAAGGNGTVTVTATANCAWAAESLASWLTVTGNATGVGAGTVTFSVQANTGDERQGNLRIGGQIFTVTERRGIDIPPELPVITSQPRAVEISSGTSATLAVTASGTAPLTYQWYVGPSGSTANPIPGATSSSYTTPALTETTTYWVRVTNTAGFVNSTAATVSVEEGPVAPPLPVITSQPESVTIVSGNSAMLSVSASSPVPMTFQWFTAGGDGPANPIPGATATTYTTPPLTATTTYRVRVTNSAGFVDSTDATVTVTVPVPVITTQPQSATIPSGTSATLSVTATGTPPLAYQWFVGASGVTTNPIAGATSSSFTTPLLTTNTTYWVRVSNAGGPVNSTSATVTVVPPPVITAQPGGATIPPGTSTTLSVTASSPLPITYQWFVGASGVTINPIAGATQSSFTTPALTATTSYWVRVANAAGATNSATATITVSPVLNFDSVSVAPGQCTSGTSYLASFKIGFEPIRGGASPQICNVTGTTITASTPPNIFFGGPSSTNTDAAYELMFPTPLASVSITRATVDPKTSLPPWTVTAFNQAGLVVSRVVQDGVFPGPSAAVFVLNGPGIVRLRVETFNGGGVATYNHPPFDNLILTPP
jgi:hypothetical protein